MTMAIEVEQVSKRYAGGQQALDKISFQVRAGGCFGLLGPNGAGKSTMMKIITGVLEQDQGTMRIFANHPIAPALGKANAVKQQIGYVPQDITLYEQLSAQQNLAFFGRMYGLKGERLKQRIAHVLEQTGLAERASTPIATFSGGMKRRINIAASLLHEPRLVVMDEPTVGIDPQSRNHIFQWIHALVQQGVTIIYSTHYMEEAEELCDDIAIMDQGRIIAQGPLHDLLNRHAKQAVYIELQDEARPSALAGVQTMTQRGAGWVLESDNALQTLHALSADLLQNGQQVRALELLHPSLSSVFLNLTGTALRD